MFLILITHHPLESWDVFVSLSDGFIRIGCRFQYLTQVSHGFQLAFFALQLLVVVLVLVEKVAVELLLSKSYQCIYNSLPIRKYLTIFQIQIFLFKFGMDDY